MTTRPMPQRVLVLAACVLGLASFYAGTRFIVGLRVVPAHPITGRPIAGLATNAAWMERSARQSEEEPDRALQLIGIRPGMTVADIGAGSGYMTTRLARLVGPAGKVYANEIQPAMLDLLRAKAQGDGLTNIVVVEGTEFDVRLPPESVDLALLVDVYHEFARPQEMLRSIRASLRPDGRLVLVEYRKEDGSIPILPTHRLSVAEARRELEPEGFRFVDVLSGLPRQHVIVFTK